MEMVKAALHAVTGPQRARRLRRPAIWGNIRRRAPLSTHWGFHRGTPIDRVYIERWIGINRSLIRGAVLEVKDSDLVVRFGSKLTQIDVVDIDSTNKDATIIADLAVPGSLPAARYDCAVVTQTLQYVSSPLDAVHNLLNSLAPGGSLILTVPGVEPCEHGSIGSDRWRFLAAGVEHLLASATADGDFDFDVVSFGNAATVLGVAAGTVLEDGFEKYLDPADPHYPVTIGARVTHRAV